MYSGLEAKFLSQITAYWNMFFNVRGNTNVIIIR